MEKNNETNRIFDNTLNINLQLWQTLITVNSILIATLIGIFSLGSVTDIKTKNLIFASSIALIISSILLVINFFESRKIYKLMDKILRGEENISKNNIKKAQKTYYYINFIERFAYLVQIVSICLFISLVVYRLYLLNGNNTNSIKVFSPFSKEKTFVLIKEKLQKDPKNRDWISIQKNCINHFFNKEISSYLEIELREKHGGNCPGDPHTMPLIGMYRIYKDDFRILVFNIINNTWEEL